jgi:uncharacterized protein (TIGR03437 family)
MTRAFCFRAALLRILVLPACAQISNIVVTNGASLAPGLPDPGSLASIFCTGLSVTGVVTAPGVPLPFTLAGVAVTVSGVPAPLLAVADLGGFQQINFQVPPKAELYKGGTDLVIVVSQGGLQGTAKPALSGLPAFSGFEFFRLGRTQFGAFQHSSDYSLVTTDHPAVPGETIIGYATGARMEAGAYPIPAGQATPLSPLFPLHQSNAGLEGPLDEIGLWLDNGVLILDDQPPIAGDSTGMSPISFVGLAPGTVGVYQINFKLPAQTPSGNNPIQIVSQYCTLTFPGKCAPQFFPNSLGVSYGQPVLLPVR